MSMTIAHNISAINTHRQLGVSSNSMGKAIEKLSSGYRINVGADDPSGLVISEQLRSQISGLGRAVQNSSEASNLIGVAEGALNEMNSILKKMRALAIHAANSGVTSPDEVAADQAELDSGIETINRIANTTKYSDQHLLNGSKELIYDVSTAVDSPDDHPLLNTKMTRVDEIFKREGVAMTVGFTGSVNRWQTNWETSAQRAYLEADNANSLCEVEGSHITAKQEFILTGTGGSRLFNFSQGTHLGQMVSSINNVRDSTGIGATLTFASDVRIDTSRVGVTSGPKYPTAANPVATPATPLIDLTNSGSYVYKTGDVQIYGAGMNNPETAKINKFTLTEDAANAFKVGYNCDGDGKIYAKIVDKATNSIEYYKDRDLTMLIGAGDSNYFSAANNSGIPPSSKQYLDGIFIELNQANCQNLDVFEIGVVGQRLDNMKDMSVEGLSGWCDTDNSIMTGVDLGTNTSELGDIFFRYTPLTEEYGTTASGANVKIAKTFKVEAFSDSSMDPDYLVASTGVVTNHPIMTSGNFLSQTVTLDSVTMQNGKNSGLTLTLNVPNPGATAKMPQGASSGAVMPTGITTGSISFNNLGMRVYAVDYGSQETIRIQNKAGNLFYQYREGNSLEKKMIDPETTKLVKGQDAQFTLNGTPILTNGLVANTTTPDFSGSLVFNAGKLGETGLAVTGHENGKLYSKAGALQGIEENEPDLVLYRRSFEPPAVTVPMASGVGATGLLDAKGNPVSLYVDLTQLDPTVEAKIVPGNASPVSLMVSGASPKMFLTINIAAMGSGAPLTVREPINVENLADGYYITDPNLKGMFIKSDILVDMGRSSAKTTQSAETIMPSSGDLLLEVNTYATNPRSSTVDRLDHFEGGMQFQLGNTEGVQDRTVYSVQSMDISNLGRITWEGRDYCLQDVLGGGIASLSRDPVLSMRILEQAINDVTGVRARLGAFQANMLETNINALNVAIENITKTESAIRDTDMAEESTNFTRFQIMQQAGTSMLAQANQSSQNVLSLLQ